MGPEETTAQQWAKAINFGKHYGMGDMKLAQKQIDWYAQALAKTHEMIGPPDPAVEEELSKIEEEPMANQNFGSSKFYVTSNNTTVDIGKYLSNATFSFKTVEDEFTKAGQAANQIMDTMNKTWSMSTTFTNANKSLMDTLLGKPTIKPDVQWRDDEYEGLAIYHIEGDLPESVMQEVIDLIHDTWVNDPAPEFAEEHALFQKWARHATLTTPEKRWTTFQDWSTNPDGCDLYDYEPTHVAETQWVPVLWWPEPKD